MSWPAQYLRQARPDLADRIVTYLPKDRGALIRAKLDSKDNVVEAFCPEDAATIVIQRVSHRHICESIPFWQAVGVRVVVDVDDDIRYVHTGNTAFDAYRPKAGNLHSWHTLEKACRLADAVTVTTSALAARYRRDAYVLPNFLPSHYFDLDRADNTDLMWPASMGTHPNDSEAIGRALQIVARETGARVRALGGEQVQKVYPLAFGVVPDELVPYVDIGDWPRLLASIGVGFIPLADTQFNRSKSFLKPLELASVGVPFVASPRADYLRLHEESGIGIFADTKNQWKRELKRLIQDDSWRREVSQKNRQAAKAYRLSLHAEKWIEPWFGSSI